MFFLKEEERTMTLHPSFFGPNIHQYLSHELLKSVEGTNQGDYYIICVLDNHQFSEGKSIPGSGRAEYQVHYRAICWRPFKEEVLDGLVSSVVESGFFVEIGPLNAFVSKTMIPPDIKYDSKASPPQWTDNGDQVIEKGTHVRVKIKGTRNEMGQLFAIATINEDFLGTIPSD